MPCLFRLFAFLVAFLLATNQARASLITNGSFEMPVAPLPFQFIPFGSEPPEFGWRIVAGSVDVVVRGTIYGSAAFAGRQFLDLDGLQPGAILQGFATIPGKAYVLSFAYSNNLQGGMGATIPAQATVNIFDSASNTDLIAPLLLTHGSSMPTDPDWTPSGSVLFTARGSATTLTFTSTNPTFSTGGVLLDAVSVEASSAPPIPEPGTWLLALAVGVLPLYKRASRASP
jgi:hypothetical protein